MDGTSGQHRSKAAAVGSVAVAIVTISDSRNPETDPNGKYLREQIEILGLQVQGYKEY